MAKINNIKRYLLLFLFITISFTSLYSSDNYLKNVKITKGELKFTFFSKMAKSDIHTFTLDNPYRRVFDFKNVKLFNKNLLKDISAKNTSFRIAQYKSNIIRLVIESTSPFKCSYYSPMLSSNIYNIVLPYDIKYKKSSKSNISKIVKIEEYKYPIIQKQKPIVEVEKKIQKETTKDVSALPWYKKLLEGNSDNKTNHKLKKRYRIVVDAGHGGHDSGATSGGYKEKDIVLQIAKRVKKDLLRKGYIVYMTRDTDHFVKLSNRTKFSNKRKADIFVSIHANAVGKKSRASIVNGIETYFLSKARTARAKRVAAKENRAVLNSKDYHTRNVILNDVLNGPKIVLSNKLAIDVQNSMLGYTRSMYKDVRDGGVRSAPFWVLVGAQTPSILVEVGYVTHSKERSRLLKPGYQTMIAKGIVKGIGKYLKNREKELN